MIYRCRDYLTQRFIYKRFGLCTQRNCAPAWRWWRCTRVCVCVDVHYIKPIHRFSLRLLRIPSIGRVIVCDVWMPFASTSWKLHQFWLAIFFHAKSAQTPNQFSIVGVSAFGSTECRKKLAVLNVAGINTSALTVIIITIFVVIKHFIFLFFSSPFCGKNFVMRACYINGFDRWDIYVFSLYNSLLIL